MPTPPKGRGQFFSLANMKNFMKPLLATVCCASLLVRGVAQAHYLRLESGKTDASLYYGEVDVH